MKFDKSKILTAITARQVKEGQKGWFGECEDEIVRNLEYEPSSIKEIDRSRAYAFRSESDFCLYPFFYPVPEPTYAERQAQWVKENNVKVGTKVRVTRTFTENEDGSRCWEYDDLVGMSGVVGEYGIASHNLGVDMSDGSFRAVPYFALEVVEPMAYYRPFKNADEFAPHRDEWFRVKKGGGFERITFYDNTGVRGATSTFITYQSMLESGERENGEPCGVKEEV